VVALQYRDTHAPPTDVTHLDSGVLTGIGWERVDKGLDPIHVVHRLLIE
jgi:hypothetical protein